MAGPDWIPLPFLSCPHRLQSWPVPSVLSCGWKRKTWAVPHTSQCPATPRGFGHCPESKKWITFGLDSPLFVLTNSLRRAWLPLWGKTKKKSYSFVFILWTKWFRLCPQMCIAGFVFCLCDSECGHVSLLMRVLVCFCVLCVGVQSRTCPAGHSLVRPSVRPGERSHSATLATVRARCPPQSAALFLPSLLPLTAASSAVSTGRWPTPRSMSCLSHSSSRIHTRMPTPKMHINTVGPLTHLKGSHADMQKLSRPCTSAEEGARASLRGRTARVTMRHSHGCNYIPLKEMSVFCWSCYFTAVDKQCWGFCFCSWQGRGLKIWSISADKFGVSKTLNNHNVYATWLQDLPLF